MYVCMYVCMYVNIHLHSTVHPKPNFRQSFLKCEYPKPDLSFKALNYRSEETNAETAD